ncbi:MAG: DUF3189 family protein [Halanaerobiales bacterium]|nr:DUF3189 family protein [Halanaerobiales bacterium]
MKVIYHDKTGRHLSILAASIHLQLINENSSKEDLFKLPYFLNTKPLGTLLYMGLDSQGKEVYVLGRKSSFKVIRNAYLGMNRIFQLNQDFLFVDIYPLSNLKIKIFDLFNSKPEKEIKFFNLLSKGVDQIMPNLRSFVEKVQHLK